MADTPDRHALDTQHLCFKIDDMSLVPLDLADPKEIAAFHSRNRDRFAPYSSARPETFFTAEYWRTARRQCLRERKRGIAYRWLLLDGQQVLAHVSMDQIIRSAYQRATLGYSLDGMAEGKGLMTRSLRHVIGFAFDTLDLHRLEANHVPENTRSAAVLARLGFQKDGFARSFLRLDGVWRNHVLNSLINPKHLQGD